jgi:PDZ domain-containing protein
LWLLGGVSHLGELPHDPGAEFRVAVWGPLISGALAAAFGVGAFIGDRAGFPAAVQGVLDYVGRINGIVFAFNLVPALPLDGGRILRAWLWRRTRSFLVATRSAARAGRAFGALLVGIGLLELFGGSNVGGIWLVFLGWFLIQASHAEGAVAEFEAWRTATTGVLAPERELVGSGFGRRGIPPLAAEPVLPVEPPVSARRRPGIAVWLVVGLIFVVAAAALYHPPYVVISPGTTFDVGRDITISGAPVTPLHGKYLATSVRLSQASALRTGFAVLRHDREVLPLSDVIPQGVNPNSYARSQQEVFRESEVVAAAAAARALGMPVNVQGNGARVVQVLRGSPAAKVLKPGDVIVAIDDQPVTQARTVGEVVRSRPTGSAFHLTVMRNRKRIQTVVKSRRLARLAGGVGIGIAAETSGLKADLPFTVHFRPHPDVGGPSAGLVYALAVADRLAAADYARGRTVAATGEMDPDGRVGPVGGVREKAVAVQRAHADLFLVPASEVNDARRHGLRVAGVDTIERALAVLSATA